ncbi:acylneuraminate cytidylyltransferase family protein [Poseidonibacter lekithochrous]|uniref:acylneuraminate cytidylyltransferase family protein n=1 Tax=Poseidonibacter lekithochrous TaxID=1904463 RepID=UPI000D388239|nr:acylneuraminate cytidylyltransferase family protein [Poseidonibacter lekithochrous]
MINNKKVLAIIPARGGSKGIPKKNIKRLNNKPLIQYSIDIAKKSQYIDSVVVSTDCEEISSTSMGLGAKVVKRPDYLSEDDSLVVDAIKYTINELDDEYDFIILLEPTSPLRSLEVIENCINKLLDKEIECVATFCETDLPPARVWKISNNDIELFFKNSNPWLPRQKLEKGYQLNGLVYGIKQEVFMNNPSRILTDKISPVITSRDMSIDIDSMLDFKLVELIMKERNE